jgi:DNA-directed RNA polymerase specialized sigma24 family protein
VILPEPLSQYLQREVEQWFCELREPLLRYWLTLRCGYWQAEEISQEAFLRLLAARQDGLVIQDVRAWEFRVARNQWIDNRRKHLRYWTDLPPDTGTYGRNIATLGPIPNSSCCAPSLAGFHRDGRPVNDRDAQRDGKSQPGSLHLAAAQKAIDPRFTNLR